MTNSHSFRSRRRLNVQKAGIITKIGDTAAAAYASQLTSWLRQRSISVDHNQISPDQDLLVVLGGDGTLLHIAEQAARYSIPVTGINLGNLGFLTELTVNDAEAALACILAEPVTLEQRLMLKVCLRQQQCCGPHGYALNDIVINKNTTDRLLRLATHAGDDFITTYRADGLIFSTPTGSTAYNLSAGGPLVYPGTNSIVVTPICPFMLSSRPIILPATMPITTEFKGRDDDECGQVLIDGKHFTTMTSGSVLEIQAAEHRLQLVAASGRDYFSVLRSKLHWGNRDDDPAKTPGCG